MRIMLDSDILIDFLRQDPPAVQWLTALGDEEIWVSGLVAVELLQGCRNKREQIAVEKLLQEFEVVWPTEEICEAALQIFSDYHLSQGLSFWDALIGQTAVAMNWSLHTFNRKHYIAIPHLVMVQPYAKSFP